MTVVETFLAAVDRSPDSVALRVSPEPVPTGDWISYTYTNFRDRVASAATFLKDLGVQPGDRVVLMMRNQPEFHFVDLAVNFLQATPVSIYNSSSPEQVRFLADHCGARVAVAGGDEFADRFPEATTVVNLATEGDAVWAGSTTVVNLATEGDAVWAAEPADLSALAAEVEPSEPATIIYTSGTTGPPKGVVITHANVVATVEALIDRAGQDPSGFRVISYLPMAHIAERMTSHYMGLACSYEVTTCPDPNLLGSYLGPVRPNVAFGVPRVWEKLYAGIKAAVAADPEKAKALADAIETALPIADALLTGTATDEQKATWEFLDEVAFSTVRDLVGLDDVRFAVSSAAPIPADLIRWFRAIGLPMSELYGMSETTAIIAWEPEAVKPGTVGRPFSQMEVRLADDGEIICRGPNVFGEYLDDPERTAAAIDADGWFHTGDVGQIDDDGYLRIVDRKKELIITAGGENISPANLEARLKMIDVIGQAAVVGDGRKFVSALLVLDPDSAAVWAGANDKSADDVGALAADPDLVAHVEAGVAEAMAGFNHAEQVKKVTILGAEWEPDGDELTPTSKLKRRAIHDKYAEQIEAMYA